MAEETVTVSGAEVDRLVDTLSPLLEGEELGLVFVTALSIALMAQNRTITAEDLVGRVRDVSDFIVMLSSDGQGKTPDMSIN